MGKQLMLNSSDGRPIWMQQPGEAEEKYSLFLTFLGLPLPRSYETMVHQTNYSPITVKQYSFEWRWKERAAAWDAEQLERNQVTKREAILGLQTRVVTDEVLDAQTLLEIWRQSVIKAKSTGISASELLKLVQIRSRIDTMLRLAAEMPSSFLPTLPAVKEEQDSWELTKDGTKKLNGDNQAPGTPSLPAENHRPSGPFQSPELWSEMGEEFSSEE